MPGPKQRTVKPVQSRVDDKSPPSPSRITTYDFLFPKSQPVVSPKPSFDTQRVVQRKKDPDGIFGLPSPSALSKPPTPPSGSVVLKRPNLDKNAKSSLVKTPQNRFFLSDDNHSPSFEFPSNSPSLHSSSKTSPHRTLSESSKDLSLSRPKKKDPPLLETHQSPKTSMPQKKKSIPLKKTNDTTKTHPPRRKSKKLQLHEDSSASSSSLTWGNKDDSSEATDDIFYRPKNKDTIMLFRKREHYSRPPPLKKENVLALHIQPKMDPPSSVTPPSTSVHNDSFLLLCDISDSSSSEFPSPPLPLTVITQSNCNTSPCCSLSKSFPHKPSLPPWEAYTRSLTWSEIFSHLSI